MADDSGDQSRTSDEEWSNFEDSEEAASVSDGSNSGSNEDDDDLTDRQSDDETGENENGQSDTETRNLLDDADFEEDILLAEEAAAATALNSAVTEDWDDKIYGITPEQQQYYDQLFLHLQFLSSGDAHIDGAVNGADFQLVDFFKKSRLDTQTLGKIWDLADVNVDGKLNRFEFSVAVHLIVLHKKGRYPIPSRLPKFFDLRMTPPRIDESPRSSEGTSMGSSQNSAFSAGVAVVQTTATLNNPVKQHSLSDDKLHSMYDRNTATASSVKEFGKDPPLCVDRVPQAIRSNQGSTAQLTGTLSLGSTTIPFPTTLPKGPPPQPPPRAYAKGHGRSASLDLNAKPLPTAVDFRSPGSGPNGLNHGLFGSDTKRFGLTEQDQRCFTLPATSVPPTSFALDLEQLDQPDYANVVVLNSARKESSDIPNSSSEDSSLSKKASQFPPPTLPLKPDYHSRCTVLKNVNAELESKLATLSQIRLQLKLRVEEVQGRSNGPNLQQ